MSKIQVYSNKGVKTGSVDLPAKYKVEANMNLIAQAMHVYEEVSHKGTSKVKTRTFINATRAKVYKQKGTGGARHGDRKAPIFVGGGVAHGPHGVKRRVSLSKNLKDRTFRMILNMKASEKEFVLVEKMSQIAKTKEANKLIETIKKDLDIANRLSVFVSVGRDNAETLRNFRNIREVATDVWQNVNPRSLFNSSLLILDKETFDKDFKNETGKQKSLKTEKLEKTMEDPKKSETRRVLGKSKAKAKKETKTKKTVEKKTTKKTLTKKAKQKMMQIV